MRQGSPFAATASSRTGDGQRRRTGRGNACRPSPRSRASKGTSARRIRRGTSRFPTTRRVDVWLKEFAGSRQRRHSCRRCRSPARQRSHRTGRGPTRRRRARWSPRTISRSAASSRRSRRARFWKESAIFVLEDDAQNGPDHVDAHRSPALVDQPVLAAPRSSTARCTRTSGVLRTMELILGLPPMSQYDAAATPMYNVFQATPSFAPFTHLAPRIPLDEKNDPTASGAEASLRMDLSEADPRRSSSSTRSSGDRSAARTPRCRQSCGVPGFARSRRAKTTIADLTSM